MSGGYALGLLAEWVAAQSEYKHLQAAGAPDNEIGDVALRFLRVDGKLRALNPKDVHRWAMEAIAEVSPTSSSSALHPKARP